MSHKITRNSNCPCGSKDKYKKCCLGKIDWNDKESYLPSTFYRNLKLYGKNRQLVNIVAGALQFDNDVNPSIELIKRACTPSAVKLIHESILELWPDAKDLHRIYDEVQSITTGFYTGSYFPYSILKGVTRHSLYSDKILLKEPFEDPRNFREEFSPIIHPEMHLENTLIGIRSLFTLWPWIESGLINFIRSPISFDQKLNHDCGLAAEARLERNPDLKISLEKTQMDVGQKEEFKEYTMLAYPDNRLKEILLEKYPNTTNDEIKAYLSFIKKRRESHHYFMPIISESGQQIRESLINFHSGANYDLTKIIASLTNSHIITDLNFRWDEMKIDRKEGNVIEGNWNGFSKAFQKTNFQFLNNVPLDIALELRNNNYLENFRLFLSRLWRSNKIEDELDDKNAKILEEELQHEMDEAGIEWQKIDGKLLKWFGGESITTLTALGPAIATGTADLLLASLAGFSAINLIDSTNKRKQFKIRYPAGFLLNLKKNN
ncbi:SEC-C domain-containing protein [Candidatus Neomarinimicrobiota bacterium]